MLSIFAKLTTHHSQLHVTEVHVCVFMSVPYYCNMNSAGVGFFQPSSCWLHPTLGGLYTRSELRPHAQVRLFAMVLH